MNTMFRTLSFARKSKGRGRKSDAQPSEGGDWPSTHDSPRTLNAPSEQGSRLMAGSGVVAAGGAGGGGAGCGAASGAASPRTDVFREVARIFVFVNLAAAVMAAELQPCEDDPGWKDPDGEGCVGFRVDPAFSCGHEGYEEACTRCCATCADTPNCKRIAAEDVIVTVTEGPTECGQADRVKVGDTLTMHYTGTIDESSKAGEPGHQFETSRGRDAFEVTIGVGQVIQGWDKGLVRLCVGARATMVIPPEMGYGERGAGGGAIPGGATLRFDVEVISVSEPPPFPDLFEELDVDQDGVLTPDEIVVHFRRKDSTAEMPLELMAREDQNQDGVVSRKEFGGPKMPRELCLEMLWEGTASVARDHFNELGFSVQWLCWRNDPAHGSTDDGKEEL
uniref:peptidylprolyl isomerase n=1 Tax=Coccolithus braarudii TaxID=221442 RepID=A0A7S0PTS5_9EUKA|mmetsp:Transcript_10668/g.23200  ORF Transcript_10668/g.23200 Transcript_10668/m.23200 type:complete len:392 (+) Transcript_10668:177-1352(+)